VVWIAYRLAPGGFTLSNIPNHYVEQPARGEGEGSGRPKKGLPDP